MARRLKDGRRMIAVSAKTADILDGTEDLTAWDDEELLRGQRRDKRGRFIGRKPLVVPQSVHEERVRRTLQSAYALLSDSLEDAIRVLAEIAQDEDAAKADRIKAAAIIIERVMPERKEFQLSVDNPPWLEALRDGIVGEVGDVIDVPAVEAPTADLSENDGIEFE